MKKLIDMIIHHPRLVILLNVLLIGILALPIYRIEINPDLRALIPSDDPEVKRMEQLEEEFGGLDIVMLAFETEDIFKPEALSLIDELTWEIENLPEVDHVISLTNYESIYSDDDAMTVDAFIQDLPEDQAESDSIALAATRDPILGQLLISEDRRFTAILIFPVKEVEEVILVDNIQRIIEPHRIAGHTIKLGGMPAIRSQITKDIGHDTRTYIPAGMLLIAVLLYFSFRSRRGVLLPLLVVLLSIVGTLGLMAWLGLMLSVLSSIMPIMLIAVASAYGIHIITRYFEECATLGPESSSKEVVANVVEHMLRPIFLAALTTIIGFLSLLSHVLPASREMGMLTAFGVLLAFILSITFIPAVLVLFKKPSLERQQKNTTNRLLSRILIALGGLIFKHRNAVLLSFALIFMLSLTGVPLVELDSNPLNYYAVDSPVRTVNTIIDEHFGGSTSMSVSIEGDIKDPQVMRQIDDIQTYLASMEGIGYTMAITDFVKLMNQSMNQGNPEFYRIPDSRQLISQYLLLYSWESSNGYLDSYVDYDYRVAQIVIRVNTMDVYHMVRIQNDLDTFLNENIQVDNQPKSEGYAVLLGNLMPMMVKGQTRSLILSVFLAAIVTGLVFRSLSAALISGIPLTFAISGVFGIMGYLGVYLNTATSMLSSIMIGIGIDYTIHFLFRFRTEIRQGLNDEEAVIKTLSTTGQGISVNGFSVIMGFAVCMLSTFIPIFFFGWLIAVSIFMCLIAALTLLPIILIMTRPKFIYG